MTGAMILTHLVRLHVQSIINYTRNYMAHNESVKRELKDRAPLELHLFVCNFVIQSAVKLVHGQKPTR